MIGDSIVDNAGLVRYGTFHKRDQKVDKAMINENIIVLTELTPLIILIAVLSLPGLFFFDR